MIKIENLTFVYPGADSPNLKNINLTIEKGDFLAIIGNNGCGKSTLCKTLNGLIPHYITGDIEGRVLVDGFDTNAVGIGELAQKVGYVYQDFENQIVRPTVLDDASFACLNFAYEDYKEKGRKALHLCGLHHKMNDYIWQLSGGQKHLLALAGTTALSPEVFILDEPIAQLDPAHAKQIYEVLKELNEKHGKTIIVIEHHTEFIADYCKHVVLMKNGEVMWKKTATEALRQVEELQASNIFPPQVTIAAKKLMDKGLLKQDCVLPTTIGQGKEVFGRLTVCPEQVKKEMTERVKCNPVIMKENQVIDHDNQVKDHDNQVKNHKHEVIEHKNQVVVSFRNVSVEYRAVKGDAIKIMNNFNLDLYEGEKIALIGSNGAGKSTLMKLMIGLLKPSKGQIYMKGKDTKNVSPEELSKLISLVYQNPEEMFIKDSIQSDIEYAMKVREVPEYEQRTKELLKRFHLEELAHRDGRLLSGGQMRRASLAIGIALNPSILLLDEPTANLDIATRREIMRTLHEMKDITETVMIATHDMQLVCDWADRIIVLSGGSIIDDGRRNDIFKNKRVTDVVGIRPPDIYYMGQLLNEQIQCYTVEEFCNLFQKEA